MKSSDHFPIFFESLPLHQMSGIRAKSGSMSLLLAYAGYTDQITFAILVNQCADSKLVKEKMKAFLSNLNKL
jgi:D-alanyl-D-alanine carboxypeptidase